MKIQRKPAVYTAGRTFAVYIGELLGREHHNRGGGDLG